MIDYALLPPEVNSGRMYAGAGSAPMLAAATSWDVLSEELASTAAFFELTVLDLTGGPWRGPAAMAMSAAALPFAAWLKVTAAQAAEAAGEAKVVAAAYETAFALTVPPPMVAANRSLLMLLIATNFFGQNGPAIAATEAHYAAMWAQDATAMYGYAGTVHAALNMSTFDAPPTTTDSTGVARQAAAVAQSANSVAQAAGSLSSSQAQAHAATAVALTQAGSSTAAPTAPSTTASTLAGYQTLLNYITPWNSLTTGSYSPETWANVVGQAMNSLEDTPNAYAGPRDLLAALAAESASKVSVTAPTTLMPPSAGALPTVTVGQATQLGGLSVPSNWPQLSPSAGQAQATLAASRSATTSMVALAEAEAGAAAAPRAAFGMAGLPGLPGAAAAAGGAQRMRFVPRYGYRHKMMMRPPSGG